MGSRPRLLHRSFLVQYVTVSSSQAILSGAAIGFDRHVLPSVPMMFAIMTVLAGIAPSEQSTSEIVDKIDRAVREGRLGGGPACCAGAHRRSRSTADDPVPRLLVGEDDHRRSDGELPRDSAAPRVSHVPFKGPRPSPAATRATVSGDRLRRTILEESPPWLARSSSWSRWYSSRSRPPRPTRSAPTRTAPGRSRRATPSSWRT